MGLMKDELFADQLLRAMGYATSGGADVGECLSVADRITRVDPTLWYDQWRALGQHVEDSGRVSETAGDVVGARSAYFRASNYYRTAGLFLFAKPIDRRLQESHRREVESFRRGAALLEPPAEVVEIPYEDMTLPGYFFRAADDDGPRPTVLLTTGYDSSAEELYFCSGAAALAHGYNVLAYEGPGQGGMIIDRGVPLRPDWEAVVTPVVDWLLTRPDVDPERIVSIGLSLGGYLAPRAAASEHRIAACVSDCGPYDVFDVAAARVPGPLAKQLPDGHPRALRLLARILRSVMQKPTAGWALRRNMLVHDLNEPLDYFRIARDFTLKGHEAAIRCPTLVCATESDDLSALAPRLYAALTCAKQYVEFKTADGARGHCEAGARSLYHQTVFAWLAAVLPADT